ncbi:MAG: alpha-amylase family glycosyl hydrolase, partial [Oscillospiraceae bacterium]
EKDLSYVNMEWGGKPTPKSFAGGDLQGIYQKLEYLKDLGINAVYLTPIFKSVSNHKYDISDYYSIDTAFGDKEVFRSLVDKAHSLGMKIVMDAVFNHCSENLWQFQDVLKNGKESPYYDWFVITSDNPLKYECFAACKYMPKFNTSNLEVQKFLLEVAVYWIKEFKIDGWRLDVSDEVSHDFWRVFRKTVKEANADFVPAEPVKEFGFVAVAAGHGLEAMFSDLGADVVVKGGQTMNPATEDILRAIQSTPARTVFVLPNNKNIIMAAEQAVKLTDRSVCVLQTRTIPQGISAMLAFDESVGLAENRIAMTKAFEKVSTGLITFAARDSEYEGHSIKEGEILALENGKLAFTDKDINRATLKLVKRLAKGDTSYVTLIHGADVTEENAESMQQLLSSKLSDKIEVMLVNGGQPVYYYIISVE